MIAKQQVLSKSKDSGQARLLRYDDSRTALHEHNHPSNYDAQNRGTRITCRLVVVDDWLGANVVLSHPTYVEDDDVGELEDDDDVCADMNQLDVVEDVVRQDVTVVYSIIITTSPLVAVLYDTTPLVVVVNGVPAADTESDVVGTISVEITESIDEVDTVSAIVEVLDSVLLVEELVDVVAGLLTDVEGLIVLGIAIGVLEVLVEVVLGIAIGVLEVLVDVLEEGVDDVLEVLVVDVVSVVLVDVEMVLLEVDVDMLRVDEVVTMVVEVTVEVITLVEVTVVVDVVGGVVGVAAAAPPGDTEADKSKMKPQYCVAVVTKSEPDPQRQDMSVEHSLAYTTAEPKQSGKLPSHMKQYRLIRTARGETVVHDIGNHKRHPKQC
ncbi:hypothetical protein V1517DRAFT_305316 [Lipomyces orientalis]|uniref:Uncharacterized protein n=1 Tax=Lipomyces orientalis TaxID=1233043 RepID=A0ACC3TWK0_9ASCO